MKSIVLLVFSILSFNTSAHENEEYKIELFCQDMNVLLQRVRVASFNIANHKTTRTKEGGPFKRQLISSCKSGHCKIVKEETSPILRYEPKHPDANTHGYVAYPNFPLAEEKAKLTKAQNAYDLVVGHMPKKAKALLVGNKYRKCFESYTFFKEQFDFQTYLGRSN